MPELFLGEAVDASHARTGTRVTVPSSDFTTHGVIVGMTGSGKTGLGIVLIEEALKAGVPCLLIDPKGDLGNLALTFPELSPAEFRPWIDEAEAARTGTSPDEVAAGQAEAWRKGLGGWGLGPADVAALHTGAPVTIYTPGSSAGVSLDIVGSLRAPASGADLETVRDEVEGYVSGLLGLIGVDADPLSSREHILMANLVENSWAQGRSLDLAGLVAQVRQPPLRKLGVFELDDFFPERDRTALAVRLNGLLAAPSFAAWSAGVPLDIDTLLRTPDGRPRAAVVSVAHLSDEERQFVVTLVLSKLVTWMRRQPGTSELRALLYIDEVVGYVPPTAAPPTKQPIMTLMKQARAFGVGTILATQNPVDVDYKVLSNAGTWMVGRLQTERDRSRLLDGMSSAAGSVDVKAVGDTIAGLAKREFVLRRAGQQTAPVFTTRWALSYLRGPLSREQIATLMAAQKADAPAAPVAAPVPPPPPSGSVTPAGAPPAGAWTAPAPGTMQSAPPPPAAAPPAAAAAPDPVLGADESTMLPAAAQGVPVRFLDPAAPWAAAVGADPHGDRWVAAAVARVNLRYDDEKADLVHDEEWEAVLFPLTSTAEPGAARVVDHEDRDLRADAPEGAVYVLPEAPIARKPFWSQLQRDLVDHLVRNRPIELFMNRSLKLYSRPGESRELFGRRCDEAADAKADQEAAALRDKYEVRAKRLRDQLDAAQDKVAILHTQQEANRNEEILSTAGSILGSFLGGRRRARSMARSLGGAAGRRGRTAVSGQRVDAAENKVSALSEDLADLEAELAEDLREIDRRWEATAQAIDTARIALEKTDVKVAQLVLCWVPVTRARPGTRGTSG